MYDHKKKESDILSYWHKNSIFEKSLEARKKTKRFVFFEGPPTANGLPHIGHFLTRIYKDLYGRYKTMRGFFVLRKSGWDTHGLPVEIEVEKELGFKSKKDIEEYGIDKFNKKAKESVWRYKTEWEDMTRRMGFWLDLNNPYITYENSYIESVWNIIKTIWDKGLLYLAHKVIPFCTRCGTPLSSHEVAQGYKTVTDRSVVVKFKLKAESLKTKAGKSGLPLALDLKHSTYILAWTTTPWTLPGNVALAVGGSIKYQVVSLPAGQAGIEGKNENYILAEELVPKILNTKYEILDTILGSDLVGLEYEPLFEIKELKSKNSYKIYDADFVSTEEGTGVVHTAVMYGEDDYNLGTKLDLPKHHTVNEQGKFVGVSKELDGKYVKSKEAEDLIIKHLTANYLLLTISAYEHDYPFCWRCDSPLLYYAKDSWFIKMSAVREQLLKNNQKINWFPEHIKEGRFGQWLKEGKDWAISRERYWGTPLPIWVCPNGNLRSPPLRQGFGGQANSNFQTNSKFKIQNSKLGQECGNIKVIGSIAELDKNAVSKSKNNYYILRHGYTTRDEKTRGIISSDLNADKYHLTSEGKKQIEKVAGVIKNNHEINLIYSSPFIRTTETAEIVAKSLHLQIHKDERLYEIRHGGCEGNPHGACPFKDAKHTMDDKHHEMGESWNDVRLRIADFMREMESKYSNKNILIVSHGDPLWLLKSIAVGYSDELILKQANDGGEHYPLPGGFEKLDWKNIPRNNYGEFDLHRPQIDSIFLKCSECGALMKKVSDLVDVWFDSGSMPFAQWHYPFDNKNKVDPPSLKLRGTSPLASQFPADFIVEGIDQTRGWFYTLLAISTLLGKGSPYKNVMSLGHVLDERGKKMSKSKGNVVSPFEVMDKVGADTARWYFYTLNQPGEYKLFAMKDVEAKLKGFIFTLQNCIRFYELYSDSSKPDALDPKLSALNLLDQWILSKLNGLITEVTESLDNYDPTTASRAIEKFVVEDLSNWWLRRSRKRKDALGLLRFLLLELAKILAPFTPFIAEDIYGSLRSKAESLKPESIHLENWPKVNKKAINKKLEEEMEEVRNVVTAGLAVRKEKQIKVRQPLAKIVLGKAKSLKLKGQGQLLELIKDELNVKEVVFDKDQKEDLVLDVELSTSLINEGYTRELIRQIQDMRKEAKYKLDEKVFCEWHSDDKELSSAISEWSGEISREALLEEFTNKGHDQKMAYDVKKEFNLASQKKIWVGVRK